MSVIDHLMSLLVEIGESRTSDEVVKHLNIFFKGQQLHQITRNYKEYRKKEKGKIAKKYNIELQQYILLIEFYSDVAEHISLYWESNNKKEDTKYRINTSLKLYYKSIQTMIDIFTLFESGSLTGSLPLWRMIYENYVVTLYLLQKSEIISVRFNEHELIDEYLILKQMTDEEIKGKDIIDQLVTKHGKHFIKQYGWAFEDSEKPISSFAQIRMSVSENEYFDFYKFASTVLHSSSLSVNRKIFTAGEDGNTNMIGSFIENLDLPFQLVIRLMKTYTDRLIDFFYDNDETEKIMLIEANRILKEYIIG